MQHIAILIHSLTGGGAERVTSHMAIYWADKGHKVTVLTIASTASNRYALPENVDLHALGIAAVSANPVAGLFNNISRVKILRKAIIDVNPDIVISMMAQANVMAGLACRQLPIKCIGSERNYPGNDYTGRLWGTLRKYTYRFLDTVITQTHTSEEWILKHTNARRVINIPNPLLLPLPLLEPIVTPNKPSDTKLLLGVGRLTDQKQFNHLIECFAALAEKHTQWHLTIVGEGENRDAYDKLISERNLNHRVKLIGRAGNISDWYQAADAFALTSATEGFPNALIEAMAHGVPCISYDCLTGPSEIIEHGINGLLVEANNKQALTFAIDSLLGSSELQRSFAKKAVNIIERLDPEIVMSQWETEIRRLTLEQSKT